VLELVGNDLWTDRKSLNYARGACGNLKEDCQVIELYSNDAMMFECSSTPGKEVGVSQLIDMNDWIADEDYRQ
jgi:hypothetical protein